MSDQHKVHFFKADHNAIYRVDTPKEPEAELYTYLNITTNKAEIMEGEELQELIEKGEVITEEELMEAEEAMSVGVDFSEALADVFANLKGQKEEEDKSSEFNTITLPKNYRPKLSNTTRTSDKLAKMMKTALKKEDRPECISLIFHGAPGTGKTIAAAYLAKQLRKKMRSYNISELQSKYIGESEKLITQAFKDAQEGGYILHLDEIDSLSGNRENADRDHEIKFVNCILQNMDTFKGIFIATTNLLDKLDPAVLRRFTLKQEFHNVTADQAKSLGSLYFKRKAPKDLPGDVFAPSDFDIVKKALLFEEESDITRAFLREKLIEEAKLRNGKDLTIPKRRMGFV